MSLLSASGLTKTFGDRVLFENTVFAVEKGDKIGFIGANGAGKTTLFKIIIGKEASTKGEAVRQAGLKIGYLEQHACSNENLTALEEALTVFSDLQLMENELEQLNAALLNSTDEKLIERQAVLTEKFQNEGIDLLVLAGWLLIIPKTFVESFQDKIINIHPALLPSFGGKGYYGLNVHKAVLEYGAKLSGATVHFVSAEVDGGAIIMQRAVEVKDGDTPETLQDRILKEEHIILPLCVKLICEGKIVKLGRQVRVLA